MPRASRWPRPAHWSHWSLRRTLLTVLIPGLLCVMGFEIFVSGRSAVAAANAAFDRSLLGAVKSMDANISTAGGGLSVELPYRLLEFFELTASGQVFYSVHSGDGLVQIGDAQLPPPPVSLQDNVPLFYDARYFDTPIRVGAYARQLDRPLSLGSQSNRVVVLVAETLESRQDFIRQLVLDTVARDVFLLMAAMALVVLAVQGALRPLQRLRSEVAARRPDDLAPVRSDRIPADVEPLVDALNDHARRYRDVVEQRRRFVDDASHQLRTPLTTLSTQMGFALRERDPALKDAALRAMARQLSDTIRQTNQMLALARADAVDLVPAPIDLAALAEATTRRHWPLARERGIDLGLDAPASSALLPAFSSSPPLPPPHESGSESKAFSLQADGHEGLLAEALSNLLHNALLHTPAGGQVTVQARLADGWAELCVRDDGPGMRASDRARVGERFLRVQAEPRLDSAAGSGQTHAAHATDAVPSTVGIIHSADVPGATSSTETFSRNKPADGPTSAAPASSGSGLGLAIAAAIAARHGGALTLEDSVPGAVPPGLLARLRWPARVTQRMPGVDPDAALPHRDNPRD